MIFGVISDLHLHNWSAYSTIDSNGLNSRLVALLMEIERAAETTKSLGGTHLFVTGDIFHVRGSVAPSVLNPTLDTFKRVIEVIGLEVFVLAGNHDLEGKHGSRLGSAVTALEGVGCKCVSETPRSIPTQCGDITMIPWIENLGELAGAVEREKGRDSLVLMHGPINGVIKGLPESGLDPDWLASLELKGVLSGHYHNHKVFDGNVVSVGAIAHHTWSDVGSVAGFLTIDMRTGYVTHHESKAPKFVELDPSMSTGQMEEAAFKNFVRARVLSSDLKEVAAIRKTLIDAGALGVTIIAEPAAAGASRGSTSVKTGMTLAESVARYIDAGSFYNKPLLADRCQSIMVKIGSI